jgi:hypothetical protein
MAGACGAGSREKVLGEVASRVYGHSEIEWPDPVNRCPHEITEMSERQKRTDIATANVVMRGINIMAVRNRLLAENYMRVNHVPPGVIERVLDQPASRRAASPQQLISEAIIPLPPDTGGR